MNGHQCLIRLHDRPARQITITSFEPEPEPLRPGLRRSGGCRWPYALVKTAPCPRDRRGRADNPFLRLRRVAGRPAADGTTCCWARSSTWPAAGCGASRRPGAGRCRWGWWSPACSPLPACPCSTVSGGQRNQATTPCCPATTRAPSPACSRRPPSATFAPGAGRSASGRRRSSRPCCSRYLLTLPQLVWNK